jgi:hypothetical protein
MRVLLVDIIKFSRKNIALLWELIALFTVPVLAVKSLFCVGKITVERFLLREPAFEEFYLAYVPVERIFPAQCSGSTFTENVYIFTDQDLSYLGNSLLKNLSCLGNSLLKNLSWFENAFLKNLSCPVLSEHVCRRIFTYSLIKTFLA